MNTMTIYISDVMQNPKNNLFPHRREIKSVADLNAAAMYDNTCVKFVDNRRKNENFIEADCAMFDVDNTHTENSNGWITPAKVKEHFPDVCFYVVYSRNHMKEKNGNSARPKFHVYFPITKIDSQTAYAQLKASVCNYFMYFDKNARDVARQFFGVDNPRAEYYEGNTLLSEFMENIADHFHELENVVESKKTSTKTKSSTSTNNHSIILEGSRHSTLLSYAASVLKRYGAEQGTAYQKYMDRAEDCSPLLGPDEVRDIWLDSLKFYNETIKTAPDYISPEKFNNKKARSRAHLRRHGNEDSDCIVRNAQYKKGEKYSLDDKYILPIVCKEAYIALIQERLHKNFVDIEITKMCLDAFGIYLTYNDMTHCAEVYGLPEKYRSEEDFKTVSTILRDILKNMYFTKRNDLNDNLDLITLENCYHPVLEKLNAEAWDGVDRLNAIYSILGITEKHEQALVHKWALQTIALLYNDDKNPVSAQGVLVLQGKQGIGKTEFFRHLAMESRFFKEGAVVDTSNKDTTISATSVWICELGEIDSTLSKKQSGLKAFITSTTDRYRVPYAQKEVTRARRTSLCGTVNPQGYLHDETGNRRYWTVQVSKIDLHTLFHHSPEWYAQFWRQMIQEYTANPLGYLLTKEEQDFVNKENIKHEVDVRGEAEFLDVFDISAPTEKWIYRTAAEVTSILNEKYPRLNLRSEHLGRNLIPKFERAFHVSFEPKTVHGKRYKLFPPLRGADTQIHLPLIESEYQKEDVEVDF